MWPCAWQCRILFVWSESRLRFYGGHVSAKVLCIASGISACGQASSVLMQFDRCDGAAMQAGAAGLQWMSPRQPRVGTSHLYDRLAGCTEHHGQIKHILNVVNAGQGAKSLILILAISYSSKGGTAEKCGLCELHVSLKVLCFSAALPVTNAFGYAFGFAFVSLTQLTPAYFCKRAGL